MDRDLNKDNYPHLNFPEIYVMHNGYKEFYETHKVKRSTLVNYQARIQVLGLEGAKFGEESGKAPAI